MKLSYNSIFFKIYCFFFAKKVGKDEYGNKYFTKKNLSPKNNYRQRRFVIYRYQCSFNFFHTFSIMY